MYDRIKKIIKPMIFIAAGIFVLCCFIKKPAEWSDYTSYIGYSVTAVTVFFVLYERYLWKIIPWNRPPVLKSKYHGVIKYNFHGVPGEKPITVTIKQTWLSVDVQTRTDINSSVTITAMIVKEYGQDILYYTYMTNPSAATQSDNPIQHGTCRMVLCEGNARLLGKYWTSSNTTGDIEWNANEMEG